MEDHLGKVEACRGGHEPAAIMILTNYYILKY